MRCSARTILLVSILSACPAALADDVHPFMGSKYWLSLGVYYPNHEFALSVNGSVLGISDEFEFGGKVDDRAALFSGEFGWQFSDNWSLALQYFETERSDRYTAEEQFQWEDLIFDVGVDIKVGTEASITRLVFSRKFIHEGPHDFRLAAGLHRIEFGASIEGIARLNDNSTEFRRSSVDAAAPLPNIGGWYRYSPSDKWMFSLRYDWLSASVNDVSGRVTNGVIGANYSLSENIGIGLNYQRFNLDVKVKDEFWRGRADITYSGPNLYIMGYW